MSAYCVPFEQFCCFFSIDVDSQLFECENDFFEVDHSCEIEREIENVMASEVVGTSGRLNYHLYFYPNSKTGAVNFSRARAHSWWTLVVPHHRSCCSLTLWGISVGSGNQLNWIIVNQLRKWLTSAYCSDTSKSLSAMDRSWMLIRPFPPLSKRLKILSKRCTVSNSVSSDIFTLNRRS